MNVLQSDVCIECTVLRHMTEQESNRIWREAQKARRAAQRATLPPEPDEGDWKGMLYGLALAIGGVGAVTLLLRFLL